jgi:hypothetical protein
MSLVISHRDKPLGWIHNFMKVFDFGKIWVFSKCDYKIIDAPQGANIFKLPYVGRCGHTYAHWMNNYLPSISVEEDKVIVFMKDNDHQSKKGMWGDRYFRELLGIAATNGFGCMVPSHSMHKRQPRNISVFFQYDIFANVLFCYRCICT